jgi:hypothetical protein
MVETDYTAEAGASDGEAKDDELFAKLKAWVRQDMKHVSIWRKEAREDYDFYSGNQWSDDDRNALEALKRPILTFNRIAPIANAVVGSERNNRREVRYIPREQGDAKANEVLTAAGEWFRDECGAEFEESDAFEDNVICGMGWTDTRLDFDADPDGAPKIERMDPLEMGWDCYAVKPNLLDASRLWRVRELSYDDAVDLTGVKDKFKLNAAWIKSAGDSTQHDQDEADQYSGEQNEQANGGYGKSKCLVVEIRWFEKQTYYRGPDIENPQEIKEYDDRQFKMIRKQMPDFPGVRQQRKVVKRAFLGSEVLGEVDQPMVPAGMFGWECMTGYRDKVKGYFYGVVKAAKDPQRWANKFFSQTQFLLNSQSKGGIGVERGAFEDDRQAEESWAKSDVITWFNQGALSGDKPKMIPKPTAQFPAGFFTLFQEAKEEINQVTGLSQEFIGTREVDQAGVLEHQRRQSSLNLLASLFDSLRRYRMRQGRTMLYLIQEHLADGRLIRIVGDDLKQYVPLTKESVANKTYDIIVDDSPTSPNEKDRTWAILMQMLPMVKDLMTPDVAMELLSLSPLPASLVEKLRQKAAEAAQQPKPPTPEEIKMQSDQQKAQLDAQGQQMDLQAKATGHQMDQESDMVELFMKQQEADLKAYVAEQKAASDLRNLAIKEESNRIAAKRANSQRTASAK